MTDSSLNRQMPIVTFGTAYYPDHWPKSEWARDLDRIAEAGLTTVRFGEFSWSWYEPRPGKFDWAPFDRFVDLVEARGLKLCLCTPTATPPPWFDTLFPDGRLLDMNGRRCLSPRHFWCWNHPGSRAHAQATIERLAKRYGGRNSLWGWQIDNEPNYAEEANLATPERMYDHNPYARQAWVRWLGEKYDNSLAALNEAWATNFWSQRYGAWDELIVPRGRTNPHAWLDWMRWREANLADWIGWQRDLLRKLTPGKPVGCNIPETGISLSLSIGQDYWAQAAGLDWVGTDLYQATGNRKRDLARLAYSTDLMRSAADATGAAFSISEAQAGPHERAWPNNFAGEGFSPGYLEQSARVFCERGAEKIWWFLWRPTLGGHEIGMNGMQSLDGSNTLRTAAAYRLSREGASLAARRRTFLRRPRAVVHYSRDSLRFATAFSADAQRAEDTFAGWHGLLESAGYRVDFADDREVTKVSPAEAALLVLPFTLVADGPFVEWLAAYPGSLVVGPHTACSNRHGHLCATHLPELLAAAWRVDFGLWRDVGDLPRAAKLPPLTGWRELSPRAGGRVRAKFSNGAPLATYTKNALIAAVDFGELSLRTTTAQRTTLVRWLRPSTVKADYTGQRGKRSSRQA